MVALKHQINELQCDAPNQELEAQLARANAENDRLKRQINEFGYDTPNQELETELAHSNAENDRLKLQINELQTGAQSEVEQLDARVNYLERRLALSILMNMALMGISYTSKSLGKQH